MSSGIEMQSIPRPFERVAFVVTVGAVATYELDFGGVIASFSSVGTNRQAIAEGLRLAVLNAAIPNVINAYVDAWNDRRVIVEFDGPVIVPVSNNTERLAVQDTEAAPEPPPAPFVPRILDPQATPLESVWATLADDFLILVPATLPTVPYTRRTTVDWGSTAHRSYVFEQVTAELDSMRGIELANERERFLMRMAFKRFIDTPDRWIQIARAEAMAIKLWINSRRSEQWPAGVLFARCLGYEISMENEQIVFACDALTQERGMYA